MLFFFRHSRQSFRLLAVFVKSVTSDVGQTTTFVSISYTVATNGVNGVLDLTEVSFITVITIFRAILRGFSSFVLRSVLGYFWNKLSQLETR